MQSRREAAMLSRKLNAGPRVYRQFRKRARIEVRITSGRDFLRDHGDEMRCEVRSLKLNCEIRHRSKLSTYTIFSFRESPVPLHTDVLVNHVCHLSRVWGPGFHSHE